MCCEGKAEGRRKTPTDRRARGGRGVEEKRKRGEVAGWARMEREMGRRKKKKKARRKRKPSALIKKNKGRRKEFKEIHMGSKNHIKICFGIHMNYRIFRK